MSDSAIRVQSVSKHYRIGALQRDRYRTLRDVISRAASAPFRWISRNGHSAAAAETIWALKDVSFEVKRGEVVGIIGRNGAGKSTLLKILSRITEPSEGQIEIRGRVGSLLEVGTGFHPELTGRENIYLNAAILGMKRAEIERKFDEIVAFAEIEKFIDTPVKRYSSGMYVRLAFAVAAHLEPEILLVDEVLAVGDAAFQKKCLGKMEDVAKEGRTVLFVSHNMAMIANLCQKAILLHDGTVAEKGETNQVVDNYLARMSNLSKTALAERKDRKGLGEIFVNAIELLDHQGNHIQYPVSGQELVIRLYYQSRINRVFKNCRASVLVSKDERPYFNMSTELVDTTQLDLHGNGCIDFIIPELPLSSGNYHLTSFLESNREIQDWVLQAADMSVVDGDFYGTGRNYPSEGWRGLTVLVKYRWQLSDDITASSIN